MPIRAAPEGPDQSSSASGNSHSVSKGPSSSSAGGGGSALPTDEGGLPGMDARGPPFERPSSVPLLPGTRERNASVGPDTAGREWAARWYSRSLRGCDADGEVGQRRAERIGARLDLLLHRHRRVAEVALLAIARDLDHGIGRVLLLPLEVEQDSMRLIGFALFFASFL